MSSKNNAPDTTTQYGGRDMKVTSDPQLDETASLHSGPSALGKGEVFSLQSIDPALNAKMHLVNNVRWNRLVKISYHTELLYMI